MARGFERTGNSLYVVCAFCSFLCARPVSSQSATLGANGSSPENVLRIGVLLPQTGSWYAGRTILGAARVAVDDINNDPTLLGNYVAELKWRDSGCAAPQGIAAMSAMVEDKNIGAIIGPGTSSGIRGFDVLPGLWTWRIASSACWGHVRLERSSHAAGSDRLFGVACSLQRRLRGHGAPRSLPCCAEREWTRPD